MPCSVFAVVSDHQTCLARLHAAGFRADEISVLAVGAFAEAGLPDGDECAVDVAWLPAGGALHARGPLATLLHGTEGIVKCLGELGVPTYAAIRYEDALVRGAAVVAVHTANGFEVETVTELLRDGGCDLVAAA